MYTFISIIHCAFDTHYYTNQESTQEIPQNIVGTITPNNIWLAYPTTASLYIIADNRTKTEEVTAVHSVEACIAQSPERIINEQKTQRDRAINMTNNANNCTDIETLETESNKFQNFMLREKTFVPRETDSTNQNSSLANLYTNRPYEQLRNVSKTCHCDLKKNICKNCYNFEFSHFLSGSQRQEAVFDFLTGNDVNPIINEVNTFEGYDYQNPVELERLENERLHLQVVNKQTDKNIFEHIAQGQQTDENIFEHTAQGQQNSLLLGLNGLSHESANCTIEEQQTPKEVMNLDWVLQQSPLINILDNFDNAELLQMRHTLIGLCQDHSMRKSVHTKISYEAMDNLIRKLKKFKITNAKIRERLEQNKKRKKAACKITSVASNKQSGESSSGQRK